MSLHKFLPFWSGAWCALALACALLEISEPVRGFHALILLTHIVLYRYTASKYKAIAASTESDDPLPYVSGSWGDED